MGPRGDASISQLRRGVLEFCVLALLREGERYSFEIVTALGNIAGLDTSEGTLYPLLGRLRREGLVQSTLRESLSGPPRRYYTITHEGEETLRAFAAQWARFRDSVDQLLAVVPAATAAADARAARKPLPTRPAIGGLKGVTT